MSASVISLSEVRKQKTEEVYASKGHDDLQELLDILHNLIDQQEIEIGDVTDTMSKRLLYVYIRYLQQFHPLLAEVVSIGFNENSFKMMYPAKYIKPSLYFDNDNAWYFGLEVKTTDQPLPDITIDPHAAIEMTNRDLDNCRRNTLVIEPVGSVVGNLLKQGYRLRANRFDSPTNQRILTFQHHHLQVILTINLTVLFHVDFITDASQT